MDCMPRFMVSEEFRVLSQQVKTSHYCLNLPLCSTMNEKQLTRCSFQSSCVLFTCAAGGDYCCYCYHRGERRHQRSRKFGEQKRERKREQERETDEGLTFDLSESKLLSKCPQTSL